MISQPNTREVLSDLIKERSDFILRSAQDIFSDIDAEKSLLLSHILIAELDGIALSYLAVYDDFPLQEIKEHFIAKYVDK